MGDAVSDADKGKDDVADHVDKGDKLDTDAVKTKTDATLATDKAKRARWTTGAKVAAGGAAAVGVAGAGAIVIHQIAEHGWDGTADAAGDTAADVGYFVVDSTEAIG